MWMHVWLCRERWFPGFRYAASRLRFLPNVDQTDSDEDGIGDLCEASEDDDFINLLITIIKEKQAQEAGSE